MWKTPAALPDEEPFSKHQNGTESKRCLWQEETDGGRGFPEVYFLLAYNLFRRLIKDERVSARSVFS